VWSGEGRSASADQHGAMAAAAGAGGLRITQVAGDNTHFGTSRLRASMRDCARQASIEGDASWPNSLPRRLTADLQSSRLRTLASRGGKLIGFRIFNLTPSELVYGYEGDRDVQTRQIPGELVKRLPGLGTSPFACPAFGVGVMTDPGETVFIEAAGHRTEYHVDRQQCQHIFVHLEPEAPEWRERADQQLTPEGAPLPADLRTSRKQRRTLQNSTYLRLYDAQPKNPNVETVLASLAKVASPYDVAAFKKVHATKAAAAGGSGGGAAAAAAGALSMAMDTQMQAVKVEVVRNTAISTWCCAEDSLWTQEDPDSDAWVKGSKAVDRPAPVFKRLNDALVCDTEEKLKDWMPFVRSMTSFLTDAKEAPKRDLITWRGSKMTPEQAALLKPGVVVRACMFVASSLDQNVGRMFTRERAQGGGFLLRFRIPAGCRNGTPVYHLARIEDEREVLCPPYTPFRVLTVEPFEGGELTLITLDILDGMFWMMVEEAQVDVAGAKSLGFDVTPAQIGQRALAVCL
jgi:hypothetical protein